MADRLNLFASVLTNAAPSSNYRGESELNRTVMQKITRENHEHPVISPEAMRNALREMLIDYGLPMNRRRLHNEEQLAVRFEAFPNAQRFADDFLFGFLVADKKAVKMNKDLPAKRDSILRMNLAVSLTPYRFNALLNQSPQNVDSSWQNSSRSALLHREITWTAYQYAFALAQRDADADGAPREARAWVRALLKAIGELNGVAGGHARSYFEMAPKSIVLRLTPSLVAGFDTYGFQEDGSFPELARLNDLDLPGNEFWLGGDLVRRLKDADRQRLANSGAQLRDNPQSLLNEVAALAFGDE